MRLIDADALKYRRMEYGAHDDVPMDERKNGILYLLKEDIDDAPTIDAVPVVRCKDCKHRQAKPGDCYGNWVVLCKDGLWRDMEFFCADGERSEE